MATRIHVVPGDRADRDRNRAEAEALARRYLTVRGIDPDRVGPYFGQVKAEVTASARAAS
jgi:hypothetical protein